MKPRATAIVPARLGSTRFPRKALAYETGKALVVHVCERAAVAESVERVVVACDAEEIASVVRAAGFEAVLTDPAHENGTSRLAEAAESIGLKQHNLVVNVQGDEPEIEASVIDGAVAAASAEFVVPAFPEMGPRCASVGTVASPFAPGENAANPNIVKVVSGLADNKSGVAPALYFSRAPIPHDRDGVGGVPPLKHVGIYAYEVRALRDYTKLTPTPLERAECLEQLRWLEHGLLVRVAIREASHHGIDTPEQYAAFVERWRAANP
ncbi:MAG: 3-deoxy-manno-octulosonate cytidylyltransferase [Phycisphaeraceae bacterium]|nr:MAG: 3-deoxy-manno-octulosonate cytidylyltransferase [Phycisphaeraceae bacterium]